MWRICGYNRHRHTAQSTRKHHNILLRRSFQEVRRSLTWEAVEWKAVVVRPCCCSHILVVSVGSSPPESGGVTATTVARGAGVKVKVGSRFDSDHAPVQAYPVPRQFTLGPGDYQAATRAPIRSDRARA
jgi:hypothetical protein